MKVKSQYIICLLLVALGLGLFSLWESRGEDVNGTIKPAAITTKEPGQGALLFNKNCGSCHLHPEPKHLTKKVWQNGVLPIMAIKMGLVDDTYDRQISEEEKAIEDANHLIPGKPIISKENFKALSKYIIDRAPDSIAIDLSRAGRNKELKQFIRREVSLGVQGPSLITSLAYDRSTKTLWIGNLNKQVFTWKHKEGIRSEI
ncbi:MAG TPA: hypothetical protein VM935_07095, partial [Chitinophagaceae bacterium]|nr:hypothetical protein [Chitinophagaceae bacterium]